VSIAIVTSQGLFSERLSQQQIPAKIISTAPTAGKIFHLNQQVMHLTAFRERPSSVPPEFHYGNDLSTNSSLNLP